MEKPLQMHYHWSSWKSPIGLGFFLATASIGAAIALFALLNVIGAVISLTAPRQQMMLPAQYEAQGMPGEMMGQ